MVLSSKTDDKRKVKIPLKNGSLFVMEKQTQDYWKHGIPKEKKAIGERISLTFREFKEFKGDSSKLVYNNEIKKDNINNLKEKEK